MTTILLMIFQRVEELPEEPFTLLNSITQCSSHLSSFHGNKRAALKLPSFSVYADLTGYSLKQRRLPSGA